MTDKKITKSLKTFFLKNAWGVPCPEILSKKFLLQILTNYTQFNVVLCADPEYVILFFLEGFLACENETTYKNQGS